MLKSPLMLFQSTRPRGARLAGLHQAGHEVEVSIHAPAWGATSSALPPSGPLAMFQSTRPRGARRLTPVSSFTFHVFQSTRPRGARPTSDSSVFDGIGFNPRARVGRDLVVAVVEHGAVVSIHAPAWGATDRQTISSLFQWFQSTRPRGARPTGRRFPLCSNGFNPRARVGRDAPGTSEACRPC